MALLLALLSNKDLSRPFSKAKTRKLVKATRKKAFIEQILLVPHTELARQFEGWIDRLRSTPSSKEEAGAIIFGKDAKQASSEDSISDSSEEAPLVKSNSLTNPYQALKHTQVLYRGCENTIDISTRFLITTPTYLAEIIDSLSIENLHTIALDEADEMLKLPNRFHTRKDEIKWQRHPPLLLGLMDELLERSFPNSSTKTGDLPKRSGLKRIIAVSASANSVFRDYVVRRSGWLKTIQGSTPTSTQKGEEDGQFDWYDFSSKPISQTSSPTPSAIDNSQDSTSSDMARVGRTLMPSNSIEHYAVKIDKQGEIFDPTFKTLDQVEQGSSVLLDPNRFLVATATFFALEEVERGLLLIPSSQSLEKTLKFLQDLAVPAIPMSQAFNTAHQDNSEPSLYVASVDSIKGIDLPGLEYVFIIPGTRAHEDSKDYMHIAGRVGRLVDSQGGRATGKVINLLDVDDGRQAAKLNNMWRMLGIEGKTSQEVHEAQTSNTEEAQARVQAEKRDQ